MPSFDCDQQSCKVASQKMPLKLNISKTKNGRAKNNVIAIIIQLTRDIQRAWFHHCRNTEFLTDVRNIDTIYDTSAHIGKKTKNLVALPCNCCFIASSTLLSRSEFVHFAMYIIIFIHFLFSFCDAS